MRFRSRSADSPAGEYDFVAEDRNLKTYTALAGYRSVYFGSGFNSWWRNQSEANEYAEEAPFVEGHVSIVDNQDGTMRIVISATDDALPSQNKLTVEYSGQVAIYDPNDTGDYAVANADFYGPFEFDSPNMNWFFGLGDQEYSDSYGANGTVLVFDAMAEIGRAHV